MTMAQFTQENRQLNLATPLGKDVLLLTSFAGEEELSRLFHYRLELLSENDDIAAKDLVGKSVTWAVQRIDAESRYLNGVVCRFRAGPVKMRGLRHYSAEVVPWLWLLTRTADCRIFQNKSVPEIVEQIFKDLGFTAYDKSGVKGPHPKWDYCVQYRETDFNFVSRLMEQEGIFYYFRHEDGKHTLVLADQKGAFHACPEKEVDYSEGTHAPNHISSWEHQYEFRPGKWTQTDYNFETPSTSLKTTAPTVVKLPGVDNYEIYDYPGEYEKKGDGDADTKVRMEEDEAAYDIIRGASTCCTFTPGGKFTLKSHDCASEKGKTYAIVSVQHWGTVEESYAGNGTGENYRNTFTCIPEGVTFRPARVTPKPVVQGPQTAVVVGPHGDEIYTDKYSRVKVQFHWDREGKKNEHSSCWIRVSSTWAGKSWGFVQIPRIGQEVIVAFLEGDPDRPLIIGNVYNAEQMPPYGLPGDKTQSGVKSRSSLGGSADNFNEICLEDKKGSEYIYIRAEKDHVVAVEHDETKWVGHDRWEEVDHDRSLTVGRDKSEKIKRNKTIEVDGNHQEDIDGSMAINVGANLTETVTLNYAETVGLAMEITVGGALAISVGAVMTEGVGGNKIQAIGMSKSETIGGSKTVNVTKDLSETIGQNVTVKIGKDYKESVTGQHMETVEKEYTVKAKKIQLVGDEEVAIKAGSAELVLKKNGDITIKGNNISIKGDGDVVIKGSKIAEN
jgi:type VI secretion system secreted protein VgrG